MCGHTAALQLVWRMQQLRLAGSCCNSGNQCDQVQCVLLGGVHGQHECHMDLNMEHIVALVDTWQPAWHVTTPHFVVSPSVCDPLPTAFPPSHHPRPWHPPGTTSLRRRAPGWRSGTRSCTTTPRRTTSPSARPTSPSWRWVCGLQGRGEEWHGVLGVCVVCVGGAGWQIMAKG
jgi:hypothetical protein